MHHPNNWPRTTLVSFSKGHAWRVWKGVSWDSQEDFEEHKSLKHTLIIQANNFESQGLCFVFSILHLPGDQRFIAWFFRVMMMEVCIFWIPKSKQIFQKTRPTWQVKSNKWSPLEVYLHAGFGSFDFCDISQQLFGLVVLFLKVEKWLVKNHTFEEESWLCFAFLLTTTQH